MWSKNNGTFRTDDWSTIHARGVKMIELLVLGSLPKRPSGKGLEAAVSESTHSIFSRSHLATGDGVDGNEDLFSREVLCREVKVGEVHGTYGSNGGNGELRGVLIIRIIRGKEVNVVFGKSFAELFSIKAFLLGEFDLKGAGLLTMELLEGLEGIFSSKDWSVVDLHNECTADLSTESLGKTGEELASSGGGSEGTGKVSTVVKVVSCDVESKGWVVTSDADNL